MEELVLMSEKMGTSTGIDPDALLDRGRLVEKIQGQTILGRLVRAGLFRRVDRSA